METERRWARETFGEADLNDGRLTRRLIDVSATAAQHPGGTVTSVMRSSAQREGAFRLIENRRVSPERLTDAMGQSTAQRCSDERLVFVAVDQSDLTFTDRLDIRGLGPDNTKLSKTRRTTQVMSALAMDARGVPLGLLDQQWWLRRLEKSPKFRSDRRPMEAREPYNWIRIADACDSRLREAQGGRPCYVADRGCDTSGFLRASLDKRRLFIVRAAQNRVVKDARGRLRKLFSSLARQPSLGTVEVAIPRGHGRRARRAKCVVRSLANVSVRLSGEFRTLSVVSIRELSCPSREKPRLEWILQTSMAAASLEQALSVIRSYTYRWRVEESHRTWKTGGCDVERSQLRSYDALRRWATILAAVATRIERLKRLSRETPDLDALTEVSQAEIDIAIAYTEDKRWKPGERISLKEAVRLIAMVGGYMGRKGDGPPGSITIGRGLERLAPAVIALERLKRSD